jgi:ferredoxin
MIPLESLYCMNCGASIEERPEDSIDQRDELDLENRVLCSDGTCTGIIVDGKCTECGKPP